MSSSSRIAFFSKRTRNRSRGIPTGRKNLSSTDSWNARHAIVVKSSPNSASKRLLDIVVAASGLLSASPLLGLIALLIKVDSRGPVFFRQERVGRGFRVFRIYKFRTMVVDAPLKGGQLTAGS